MVIAATVVAAVVVDAAVAVAADADAVPSCSNYWDYSVPGC